MQNDEEEIRQLVSTWMAASKVGDVETVLSLMADDVVFLVPGQAVMRKADFAAATRAQSGQGAPQFDGAQPMTRAGHTLSILNKQGGKWVLARDANLLASVPGK